MHRVILIAVILGFLPGCERTSGDVDNETDRKKIIGCYRSGNLPNTVMEIGESTIRFDDQIVYDRYKTVLSNKDIEPVIYVWPRLIPFERAGRLEFCSYRGGEGGLTLIAKERNNEFLISLATFEEGSFPDGHIRWFTKSPC